MNASDLTLVVPCYNEAERLRADVFLAFVRTHPGVRFLFVDDGSTDRTSEIHAAAVKAAPEAVAAIRLGRNQGKAEAVRSGILEALRGSPSLVGFWDADLATPLAAIDDFLALAAKRPEFEIILGSRVQLMGRDIRRKGWRHYLGRVFATCASLALGIPVYDTQCGAKVFRVTPDLPGLFAERFRSPWIFDVEILSRYLALGPTGGSTRAGRVYELAVRAWHDVPGSKLGAADFFRAIFELAAIWRDGRVQRDAAKSGRGPER
jgi:dolichyl-phosphate beta-glucosyltransferase